MVSCGATGSTATVPSGGRWHATGLFAGTQNEGHGRLTPGERANACIDLRTKAIIAGDPVSWYDPVR